MYILLEPHARSTSGLLQRIAAAATSRWSVPAPGASFLQPGRGLDLSETAKSTLVPVWS